MSECFAHDIAPRLCLHQFHKKLGARHQPGNLAHSKSNRPNRPAQKQRSLVRKMCNSFVNIFNFVTDMISSSALLECAIYRRVRSQRRNKFDLRVTVATT